MDPISDRFPWVSTYNYAENEPVAHIDLWGLQKVRAQWAKNIQQGAENTADFLFNRDNPTRQNLRVSWQNFRSEARATIDGLMSKLPDESRPNAKEYHDSGSRIKGPGITILSNDPHMANGVIDLSTSEEGSDLIIEQGDATSSMPPEGGGALGGVATGEAFSKVIYNFGQSIGRIKDTEDKINDFKDLTPPSTFKVDTVTISGQIFRREHKPNSVGTKTSYTEIKKND